MHRIKHFASDSLIKNSIKLSSSNIFIYVLPLIVTPILTRLYSPGDFGDWGVFSSTYMILQTILFASYDYVIIKADDDEVSAVSLICILVSFFIIFMSWCTFSIGKLFSIEFLNSFPYKEYLILYLIITAFSNIFQNIANKESKYNLMAFAGIITGVSQASLRVILGLLISTSLGLIAGAVYAHLILLLFYIFTLHKDLKKYYSSRLSYRRTFEVATKYISFPKYDAPATLLSFSAFNLPVIILSIFYSKYEIGSYTVIIQLLLLPISFIGAAMGKVYYQQLNQFNINDTSKITSKTIQVLKITFGLSLLPISFLAFGGDYIIEWFLGSKWEIAGNMALCLSVWSVGTIITQPLLSLYRYLGVQKNLLLFDSLYFTLSILSTIICCLYNTPILITIIVYSFAVSIAKYFLLKNILNILHLNFKVIPHKLIIYACV